MSKIYFDFDRTLYDTDNFVDEMLNEMASIVCKKYQEVHPEEVIKFVKDKISAKQIFGISSICEVVGKNYGIGADCFKECVEKTLKNGEKRIYGDAITLLKVLSQKGYQINILTYMTKSDYDYQLKKLEGSKITSWIDNIIFTSKEKGSLGLDYENSIFVDDNPKDLRSLHSAGVKYENLYRIKRENTKYFGVKISDFEIKEISSLKEIKF